jgi:hypothetical protein
LTEHPVRWLTAPFRWVKTFVLLSRKAFRIARYVFRAERRRGARVDLLYASGLGESLDLAGHAEQWARTLDDLAGELEVEPPAHVTVLVIASATEAQYLFQRPMSGMASWRGPAVVITAEAAVHPVECAKVMRHEVTHLLSLRLGPRNPSFKIEGLARWKEHTGAGTPADLDALLMVLGADYRPLDSLLDRAGWERDTDYSYAIAGSFTGFLVRRIGWPAFKDFYRRATASNFTDVFRGAFGVTLLHAERQWRQELLGQRDAFEPVLSRRLGERRAVDAYGRGELFACLEQADSLMRTGDASPRAIWFGAAAHRQLGDFGRAADFLERALAMHDDWFDRHRPDAWLELGQLYDLLTWRARALEAYGRALACKPTEAVQAAAREGIEKPFVDGGES